MEAGFKWVCLYCGYKQKNFERACEKCHHFKWS